MWILYAIGSLILIATISYIIGKRLRPTTQKLALKLDNKPGWGIAKKVFLGGMILGILVLIIITMVRG